MNKYIIERDMPGIGKLTGLELREISQKACASIKGMGAGIRWLHSYVTGDKVFCVYEADNEELIRESSKLINLPITRITLVEDVVSPSDTE